MIAVASHAVHFTKRPPTPPKESSVKHPNDGPFLGCIIGRPLLDTPEESPSSSTEYFNNSSGKRRKRVEFNLWGQFQKPAGSKDLDGDDCGRRHPPSRECNPPKSILKISTERLTPQSAEDVSPIDSTDLPAMLRSTVLHLASDSRPSRLDAYTSLLGCLSTYEDVPNAKELTERVAEISEFMKRDAIAKFPDGSRDIQLATQVLKLATVFLYTKGMETLLSEDFCSFILEQALGSLEDDTSPKSLVLHYMHLVEKQKFSARVMSVDRQERLLSALGSSTVRSKGNRIMCHRLNIYLRMVSQAKSVMILRTDKWMDHLITGMLSSTKEIRSRAIAFGIEAGLQLGTTSSVSQECIDLFNRLPPGGEKFVNFFSARLLELVASKEDGVHVPQIWSVILLFLRSRRRQVESWEHLSIWLQILQTCFNSTDPHIKFHANLAWNRLIFAVGVDASTSAGMARMLRQPIVVQLERKSDDKNSRIARQVARSSYCTLIYYALRPSASHAQIDMYWELYIAEVLPKSFSMGKVDRNHACEILAALLYTSGQPKMWDENKANMSGPTKPEDLFPIDPKWIRLNAHRVLSVFEKWFSLAERQSTLEQDAPILTAWTNFMSALYIAGSKEIKVSTDAIVALAGIMNFFKSLLKLADSDEANNQCYIENFRFLLEAAVAKLGHITFNEKRLSLDPAAAYEAIAETPSGRSSSSLACVDSATGHLITLLLRIQKHSDSSAFSDAISSVVQTCSQSASTRYSRLKILRNLANRLLEVNSDHSLASAQVYWRTISEGLTTTLQVTKIADHQAASPENAGHGYRDIVRVLGIAIKLRANTLVSPWQALYRQLVETIRKEVGDAGVCLAIQEPLAEDLSAEIAKSCDDVLIELTLPLLSDFRIPVNRKSLEKASVMIWGTPVAASRANPDAMNSRSLPVICNLLQATYSRFSSLNNNLVLSSVDAVGQMIRSCPLDQRKNFIGGIQGGLAVWFEDLNGLMQGPSDMFKKIEYIHEWALESLQISSDNQNKVLKEFQILIGSFLRSGHSSLLNKAIAWWNHNIGCSPALEYPEALLKPLSKLKEYTSIQLPGFPDDSGQPPSPLRLIVSQELQNYLTVTSKPKSSDVTIWRPRAAIPPPTTPSPRPPHLAERRSLTRSRQKTTPKAKLRHDDSQIQFANIDSSPPGIENNQSPLLTERQREVREKQGMETTVFQNMGSSPRIQSRADDYSLPTMALKGSEDRSRLHVDMDNSPSLPPNTIINSFLGSSPTPKSSRKRSAEPFSDDAPPSSPPTLANQLEASRAQMRVHQEDVTTGQQSPGEDYSCNKGFSNGTKELLVAVEIPTENPPPSFIIIDESETDPEPHAGLNDDICVKNAAAAGTVDCDAGFLTPTNGDEHCGSADMDKQRPDASDCPIFSTSQNSNCMPAEVDEVSAQIIHEMALASSQGSESSIRSVSNRNRPSRKRRRSAGDAPNKKAKSSDESAPKAFPQQPSTQDVCECVLIETSSAANNADRSWPLVRREPSPSVSGLSADACPEKGYEVVKVTPRSAHPSLISRQDLTNLPAEKPKSQRRPRRLSQKVTDMALEVSSSLVADEAASSPALAKVPQVTWVCGPHGSQYAYIAEPSGALPVPASQDGLEGATATESRTGLSSQCGSGPEPANMAGSDGAIPSHEPGPPSDAPSDPVAAHPPTAATVLHGLQEVLKEVRQIRLQPEEERAMVGVLFESIQAVHEAGRRHSSSVDVGNGGDVDHARH